jgi:HSP20 family molecular chaperone IbpA
MSTTLTRWRDSAFAPLDWAGFFPMLSHEIRVEQYVEDGHYVVRAELPGVDPEHEVELTVAEGVLKIQAERNEEKHDKAHSEFHYGRFLRTIALPIGTKEETAVARYGDGVLEITFAMGEPKVLGRRIAIDIGKGASVKKVTPKPMGAKNN